MSILRNFRMSINHVLDIMAVKLDLHSLSDQIDATGSSWLDQTPNECLHFETFTCSRMASFYSL